MEERLYPSFATLVYPYMVRGYEPKPGDREPYRKMVSIQNRRPLLESVTALLSKNPERDGRTYTYTGIVDHPYYYHLINPYYL